MASTIPRLFERLLETGLADTSSIEGCSEAEIETIESRFGIRLPRAYREFLRLMGRSAGKFLVGSDYSYPKLLGFRDDASELLKEQRATFRLSRSDYVFLFHQGYTFLFFDSAESEDPAVYMFTEGDHEANQIAARLTDWLASALEDDFREKES